MRVMAAMDPFPLNRLSCRWLGKEPFWIPSSLNRHFLPLAHGGSPSEAFLP